MGEASNIACGGLPGRDRATPNFAQPRVECTDLSSDPLMPLPKSGRCRVGPTKGIPGDPSEDKRGAEAEPRRRVTRPAPRETITGASSDILLGRPKSHPSGRAAPDLVDDLRRLAPAPAQ